MFAESTDENNNDLYTPLDVFVLAGQKLHALLEGYPKPEGGLSMGICPVCGANSIARERRLNGNDRCANGHIYSSAKAEKRLFEVERAGLVQRLVELSNERDVLTQRVSQLEAPKNWWEAAQGGGR